MSHKPVSGQLPRRRCLRDRLLAPVSLCGCRAASPDGPLESVDRIIYSIFQRFNLEWKQYLHKQLDITAFERHWNLRTEARCKLFERRR